MAESRPTWKYSHHPDGQVLFSQDGRVLSAVHKQGVGLSELEGHFFTVHATGLTRFSSVGPKDERDRLPNPRRTSLSFRLTGRRPRSVKFVGRLHSSEGLQGMLPPGGVLEPRVLAQLPDGAIQSMFVCSPPAGSPGDDRFLLLSCEPVSGFGGRRGASLLFIGGFDPAPIAGDHSKATTMLALSYPVRNAETLRRWIGSIDFRRAGP